MGKDAVIAYAVPMVEGMSIREAARTVGLHRDTVCKMLEYSVPPGYRRCSAPRRTKLELYTGVIDQILEKDHSAPEKQRRTAKRIYERLPGEYGWRKLLTTGHLPMDRPNHPTSHRHPTGHRTVQRPVRMAGRMNWLTEPLEKITRVVQWFSASDPGEDIGSAAPDIVARYQ